MNRRTFLASSASLLAAQNGPPKKIAAIITEYRLNSHADVIVGKYLEGYRQNDQPPYPRSKIVSMFTEQIPKNDMSRERAQKYKVPIFRTVADALTMGGSKLAVDGVLLIGEHGDYPTNEKLQKLYPRLVARDFAPAGYAFQALKDLDMLHDLAKALQVPTPMSAQAASLFRILNAKGHGELDGLAVLKLYDPGERLWDAADRATEHGRHGVG